MARIAAEVADQILAVRYRIEITDDDALYDGQNDGELRDPKPDDPAQIRRSDGGVTDRLDGLARRLHRRHHPDENLFPVEIENTMPEHEAIAEAAVVGITDDVLGEQVACFMRPAGDQRPTDDELKAFARARMAPQKTPRTGCGFDEWPLTGPARSASSNSATTSWADSNDPTVCRLSPRAGHWLRRMKR